MLKVFLVDDELTTRRYIKSSINWEEEGFELVGEAGDGELAYPLIRQTRPDIVLTDIQMPFMDGIELSRLVRTEFPEMCILIMGTYDEFQIVAEELQNDIPDYTFVQKPLDMEKLLHEMHLIRAYISERFNDKAASLKKGDTLQQNLTEKQAFFQKLISGSYSVSALIAEGRSFGIELNAACYNLLLVQFNGSKEETKERVESFRKVYEELRKQDSNVFVVTQGQEEFALLLLGKNEKEVRRLENKVMDQCRQFMMEFPTGKYFGVAGHPVHHISDLKLCYQEVLNTYTNRLGYGDNQIVPSTKLNQPAHAGGALFDPDELNLSADGGRTLERFLSSGVLSNLELFLGTYIEDMDELNIRSMLFRHISQWMHIFVPAVFCRSLATPTGICRKTSRSII